MRVEKELQIEDIIEEHQITYEYDSEGACLKLRKSYYEILTTVEKMVVNNTHLIGERDAL